MRRLPAFFAFPYSRPQHLRRGLVAAAVLVAGAALPAATITVNTTADTLAGMTTTSVSAFNASATRSLRGAIIAVNNDSGSGHTINLPAGTYTLALADSAAAAAAGEDAGATGDLDILKSVTIVGVSAANTIIAAGTTSSNGVDKLISVNPRGMGSATAVVLSGVTLRNGRNQVTNPDAYNNVGGAMDFDSMGTGTLTLTDVVFDSNATTNGDGGALALFSGGVVTISNCTFSGNTARSSGGAGAGGGAVYIGDNYGVATTVTFTSCIFDGNKTAGTVVGSGGAILSNMTGGTARLILHGGAVTNNRTGETGQVAAGDGGGICAETLTLDQGCVVTGNTAARFGGGVYVTGGTSAISGSTLTGNATRSSAGAGGAVYVNRNTTTISNCRIVANTAAVGAAVATNIANIALVSATNNWWGANAPAASLFGANVLWSPMLQLTIAASPASVLAGQGTSTVTAKLTTNSSGASGLGVPNGATVSFGGLLGTISPTAATLANGQASAVFTAGATGGNGNATATVDGQTVTASITVTVELAITSANAATFRAGVPGSFTVVATGYPVPTISTPTTLPSGLTLSAAGVLSGTVAAGTYPITIEATNGPGSLVSQAFTLRVLSAFQQWQQQYFGSSASDPAIAGETADPDGDGLVNLVEYGLGLDPLLFTATTVVVDTTTGALRLTAAKNTAATDVTFVVEVSSDLVNWTSSGTTVVINTAAQLQVLDNTPLTGAARRFIRLKITKS